MNSPNCYHEKHMERSEEILSGLYQLRHKHEHSGGLTKALFPPAPIPALNQVCICQSLKTAFGPEKEPCIYLQYGHSN